MNFVNLEPFVICRRVGNPSVSVSVSGLYLLKIMSRKFSAELKSCRELSRQD